MAEKKTTNVDTVLTEAVINSEIENTLLPILLAQSTGEEKKAFAAVLYVDASKQPYVSFEPMTVVACLPTADAITLALPKAVPMNLLIAATITQGVRAYTDKVSDSPTLVFVVLIHGAKGTENISPVGAASMLVMTPRE
jgi:hypothetical protein